LPREGEEGGREGGREDVRQRRETKGMIKSNRAGNKKSRQTYRKEHLYLGFSVATCKLCHKKEW